jgi:hypothetical protein
MDDPAWNQAVTLPPMTQSLGAPPLPDFPYTTTVKLLWSPDDLYVRFVCRGNEIYTPEHGRDAPIYKGDAVEVFLDPVGDGREWVELECNANNDVFDQIFLCTADPKFDPSLCQAPGMDRNTWNFLSWNLTGLRTAAAKISLAPGEQDWIVDLAIPAKELLHRLGMKQYAPMTLRGDFLRYAHPPSAPGGTRTLFSLNWSPVSYGRPHRSPAAYGYIVLVPAAAAGSAPPASGPAPAAAP